MRWLNYSHDRLSMHSLASRIVTRQEKDYDNETVKEILIYLKLAELMESVTCKHYENERYCEKCRYSEYVGFFDTPNGLTKIYEKNCKDEQGCIQNNHKHWEEKV